MSKVVFYQSNGIPVDSFEKIETSFYIQENIDQQLFDSRFIYDGDFINYELDNICVELYDVFTKKIFQDMNDYYKYLEYLPTVMLKAGLDSDCNISKEQFQQFLEQDLVASHLCNEENKSSEEIYIFCV